MSATAARKRARNDEAPLLAGRVVVVTGGAGGIGRAAALVCASKGAAGVFVTDINAEAAAKTAADCQALGCNAASVGADVTRESEVDAMLAAAVARFGRVDCAFNAAGIEGQRAPLHESTPDNFDRVLSVNLRGIYLCMRAQIAQMLKQAAPDDATSETDAAIDRLNYSIVNMSSSAGQAGMPEFSCYSASKFAIIGLTKSAAKEYAGKGIRINALCPSTTATPMVERFTAQWPEWQAKQNASFPVGRVGEAEEVAAAAAWLFSAECRMLTGTCLTIDGAASS